MPYYKKSYNSNSSSQKSFSQKSIVIFVHGLSSDANGMNSLIQNILSLGPIKNYYNMVDGNVTINERITRNSNEVKMIKRVFDDNPNANVMVRMAFNDDMTGAIDDQAKELGKAIKTLRNEFEDKKIVTVGHSKGGVVAMECAITIPGSIDKLISVNTPYTTTIAEHLSDFISQLVITICAQPLIYIMGHPAKFAVEYVTFSSNILQNTFKLILDNILDNKVVKLDLKQRWNQLANKPRFTPIATRALILDGNKESDFAVPVDSALATGFIGKSYSDDILLVKNDSYKIPIVLSYFADPFQLVSLVAIANSFVGITNINEVLVFLNNFYTALLSVAKVDSNVKIRAADYVHARMDWLESYLGSSRQCLDNSTVALRVLAGLED